MWDRISDVLVLRDTSTMIERVLDLHIHSKYSRACSKNLELPAIAKAARVRGIDIVATGDFTHPKWFSHMREHLVEVNDGVYGLRAVTPPVSPPTRGGTKGGVRFIIGTEIASIKKHKGQTRRVHHLIFAPSLDVAEKFNKKLQSRGINLTADGRPIIGMTSYDILSLMLETDERMVMIPAHAWTPWFGIFGSKGGYDRLEEAFDDLSPHIFAIETGLSSDPLMNWRCSWLDSIALISNSDAHSPQKLGREANVLEFGREDEITYDEIMRIIRTQDRNKFKYTIEFYPEEGRYHYDGHRECKFSCPPEETKKYRGVCPKCKRPMVIGVLNRVQELADRTVEQAKNIDRIPYKSLVPLPEILADTFQCGVGTKKVKAVYDALIKDIGSEFFILLHASREQIAAASTPQIAEAVHRVRRGEVSVIPGYDGEFGTVKVFAAEKDRTGVKQLGFSLD